MFELQPNASLELNTFNGEIRKPSTYNKNELPLLKDKIDKLTAGGSTALLDAALDRLKKIKEKITKNHHVLLFTDGQETSSKNDSKDLDKFLTENFPEGDLSLTLNKFCLVNFKTDANTTLTKIANLFKSPVIDVSKANFTEELQENNSNDLKEWAAIRELFDIRFIVSTNQSQEQNRSSVSMAMDLSGASHNTKN